MDSRFRGNDAEWRFLDGPGIERTAVTMESVRLSAIAAVSSDGMRAAERSESHVPIGAGRHRAAGKNIDAAEKDELTYPSDEGHLGNSRFYLFQILYSLVAPFQLSRSFRP